MIALVIEYDQQLTPRQKVMILEEKLREETKKRIIAEYTCERGGGTNC